MLRPSAPPSARFPPYGTLPPISFRRSSARRSLCLSWVLSVPGLYSPRGLRPDCRPISSPALSGLSDCLWAGPLDTPSILPATLALVLPIPCFPWPGRAQATGATRRSLFWGPALAACWQDGSCGSLVLDTKKSGPELRPAHFLAKSLPQNYWFCAVWKYFATVRKNGLESGGGSTFPFRISSKVWGA